MEEAGFIHVHAFSYSPRPNTAAAQWADEFIRPEISSGSGSACSARWRGVTAWSFRKSFVGEEVEILVEHPSVADDEVGEVGIGFRHGRCERYFPVFVEEARVQTGQAVRVRVERVTAEGTWGRVVSGR